jgi:hypothetical protein
MGLHARTAGCGDRAWKVSNGFHLCVLLSRISECGVSGGLRVRPRTFRQVVAVRRQGICGRTPNQMPAAAPDALVIERVGQLSKQGCPIKAAVKETRLFHRGERHNKPFVAVALHVGVRRATRIRFLT